jgi:hypothetical protein
MSAPQLITNYRLPEHQANALMVLYAVQGQGHGAEVCAAVPAGKREEVMSQVAGKDIGQVAAELVEELRQLAPEALETSLHVVRLEAIGQIAVGLACVIITFFGIRTLLWAVRRAKKEAAEDEVGIMFVFHVFGVIGISLVPVVAGISAADKLGNVWNWIGIFEPELRLARYVLGKVL